jgi:Trk K+ transport system NAD-binding subunit
MNYVIDAHSAPALVVVITDDDDDALVVAQRYANQTGHPVLIAEGPTPGEAQVLPILPSLDAPMPEPEVKPPRRLK